MEDKPLTDSADLNEQLFATSLAEEELYSQSVDLSQWFSSGLTPTGSFDLGIVAATQFGNLLDALPVPILLVDGSFDVVFVNKACVKISPNYERVHGVPFTTLVPRSRNAEKARWLLRKVFATRKAHVADGIIQMEAKKIWGRLHFSAIRIGRERYVLVLIEDLTGEKTQLLISRRDDSHVQRTCQALEKLANSISAELQETRSKLAKETQRHVLTSNALAGESRKAHTLAEFIPGPAALVRGDGTCEYINEKFRELFDYSADNLPDISAWWNRTDLPEADGPHTVMTHLESLADTDESAQCSPTFTMSDTNGSEKRFVLRVVKLASDDYLLLCEEATSLT